MEKVLRDLINSPVAQAYQQFDVDWLKIELKGHSVTENNYDGLIEMEVTASLHLNINPELV